MSFVQIVEFRTSDLAAFQRIDEEWRQATEGKRTFRREVLAADRNQPGHYFVLVFFDSYESAMENSALPETQAAAQKWLAAANGAPVFHDLDVLDDRQ